LRFGIDNEYQVRYILELNVHSLYAVAPNLGYRQWFSCSKMPDERSRLGSRAEIIYQQLREAILLNQLPTGSRLSEAEVASRYDVSRTPVREALRMLELDGLIRREGRRVTIISISRDEVLDIYPIVEALEGMAGRLACAHMGAEQLERMRRLNAALLEGVERQAAVDLARTNEEFHAVYIEQCHNLRLIDEIAKFHLLMRRFRMFGLQIPGRRQLSVKEHEAIINAFASSNEDDVERAIRYHIATARETLLKTIQALAYLPG